MICAKPTHILWVTVSVFWLQGANLKLPVWWGRLGTCWSIWWPQGGFQSTFTPRTRSDVTQPAPPASQDGDESACRRQVGAVTSTLPPASTQIFKKGPRRGCASCAGSGSLTSVKRLADPNLHRCHPNLGNATEDPSQPAQTSPVWATATQPDTTRLPTGITVMNSSIIHSHLNKQFC